MLAKRDAIGIDLCARSAWRGSTGRSRSGGGPIVTSVVGSDVFLTLNPEHVLVFAKD